MAITNETLLFWEQEGIARTSVDVTCVDNRVTAVEMTAGNNHLRTRVGMEQMVKRLTDVSYYCRTKS